MSKKFKTYSASFKAKVIRELLKDESSIAELASKNEITTKTIRNWQNQFLNGIEAVFEQGNKEKEHKEQIQIKSKELDIAYREIGSLTTQVNWIKKKSDEIGFDVEKGVFR